VVLLPNLELMADFGELGLEGTNHIVDRYFEKAYDKVRQHRRSRRDMNYGKQRNSSLPPRRASYSDSESDDEGYDDRRDRRYQRGRDGDKDYNNARQMQSRPARPSYDGPTNNSRDYAPYAAAGVAGGAGALAAYNDPRNQRSSRPSSNRYRSKSRGIDRSRSRSSSRSRSRSRHHRGGGGSSRSGGGGVEGIEHKIKEAFDPSKEGIGFGIAGAVIGGLAGREFGDGKNRGRATIAGAVIGGLGANLLENQWQIHKGREKRKVRREEKGWEQKFGYDGRPVSR